MENEKKDKIIDLAGTLATRADEFEEVLILARKKDGTGYSADNGLQVHEAIYLTAAFTHWLLSCVSGTVRPGDGR
ncbi:MAG TPA: hypothetical protein VFW94_24190 [Candidatus Acidoferrales bacterium]|nr:hypothetical protein [Candidatus Acidoferrales bacterium]